MKIILCFKKHKNMGSQNSILTFKKLVDFSDPEEVTLYNTLIESYHAFLKYKMPKIISKFPTGVRYDDTWRYMYANPDVNVNEDVNPDEGKETEESETDKKSSSKNRRKLALLFHPDKCTETDARQLFEFVWATDEETITDIINSDDPIGKIRGKIQGIQTDGVKETEIDRWLRGYPYNWFCDKTLFVTEEEYILKKEMSKKCFEMKVINEKLRQELESQLCKLANLAKK
jgi:hypothetical protein